MNLFRSEEHVQRWSLFNPASRQGLIPLADLAAVYSAPSRRHMLDADYLSSWYPRRYEERRKILEAQGRATTFWLGAT